MKLAQWRLALLEYAEDLRNGKGYLSRHFDMLHGGEAWLCATPTVRSCQEIAESLALDGLAVRE